MINEQLAEMLTWSEDRLFGEIGRGVETKELFPRSLRAMIDDGRFWFESNMAQLRKQICPQLTGERGKGVADAATVLAALGDAAETLSGNVSVYAAAILVTRCGIDKFCAIQPS